MAQNDAFSVIFTMESDENGCFYYLIHHILHAELIYHISLHRGCGKSAGKQKNSCIPPLSGESCLEITPQSGFVLTYCSFVLLAVYSL